ncbi:MAG: exodeoxyribonuclease VII small subunit [Lachnospiraceae bacterium]|nr:exodeoxyribonuclease VII small subunit [Lachnospiraceae bacterium]
MSDQTNENRSLEQRMDDLDLLIEKMEADDVSLDESFALYKQGLNEIKEANDMLDAMEKAMLVLTEDGETEEFS